VCTAYECTPPAAPAFIPQCQDRGVVVWDLTDDPEQPVEVAKVGVMALNAQQVTMSDRHSLCRRSGHG
jgi:hypothetical protein